MCWYTATLLNRGVHQKMRFQQISLVKLYDLREHNVDRLRYYLGVYPWGYFLQSNDVEFIHLHFVDIVLHILSECVQAKTVVLGPKDPQYVTPLVKMLLKRRNRLRRQGRHDEMRQTLSCRKLTIFNYN